MAASLKSILLDAKAKFDSKEYAECLEVLQNGQATAKKSYDYFV